MRPLDRFLRARDLLASLREDHEAAAQQFRWPELTTFNWVSDYFDVYAAGNARAALVIVDDGVAGWTDFADAYAEDGGAWQPAAPTAVDDPLLLYFTSGTTARPKLVLHTHTSYPVGHLSTMYWLGVKEGDRHLNISSPGWAKHAWSCFFAPWNAGATVVVHNYARFRPQATLELLARERIDTLCAPPTVWRMLVLEDLAAHRVALREVISAGEPLNPEVIEAVRKAWNLTVRDGYGQTETTALIGNCPGDDIVLGSMGRPLPGYRVTLIDAAGVERDDGEIAVGLSPRPTGLMAGYVGDPE